MKLKTPSGIILAYCFGVILTSATKIDTQSAIMACVVLIFIDIGLHTLIFKEN